MKKVNINELNLPTTSQLEFELKREKYKSKYIQLLKNTLYVLLIVIALAILSATLIFPVFQITGESMEPSLNKGEFVVSVKGNSFKSGDIIAFYYNNRILVKRVIAVSSDVVNIDLDGNVYVNDELLMESYINEKKYGDVDIEFPYQVPEESYFVLGDDRENSVDSRNSLIGSIKGDEVIGRVVFRVWPFKNFGVVK